MKNIFRNLNLNCRDASSEKNLKQSLCSEMLINFTQGWFISVPALLHNMVTNQKWFLWNHLTIWGIN